jgi:hypothetical protein
LAYNLKRLHILLGVLPSVALTQAAQLARSFLQALCCALTRLPRLHRASIGVADYPHSCRTSPTLVAFYDISPTGC